MTDEVPDALCKLLNGFFLTVTCRGQIVLISSSVEQHLGHCQVCVMLYNDNSKLILLITTAVVNMV